ncbi:MAG: FkbM family methyltransferase [Bosea sp. (in: a-proteobacteria)]
MSLFTITQTRHGQMVVLTNDTYISRSLIEYGEWTETEFELMAQVLQPGDNVIDVGANIGSLTVPIAKTIGPSGHVFAFEPQPRIFQVLAANCVLNHATNARLFHAGAGSVAGEIEIAEISYSAQHNYGAIPLEQLAEAARINAGDATRMSRKVPIVTIDEVYDLPTLKFIKIDVEGMEVDVLKGAKATISKMRPALYIENEFPDRSPELIATVRELGYEAYWHIAPCFNPNNARGRKDDVFGGVSCVNMLCVPAEKAGTIDGLPRVGEIDEHPRKAA